MVTLVTCLSPNGYVGNYHINRPVGHKLPENLIKLHLFADGHICHWFVCFPPSFCLQQGYESLQGDVRPDVTNVTMSLSVV